MKTGGEVPVETVDLTGNLINGYVERGVEDFKFLSEESTGSIDKYREFNNSCSFLSPSSDDSGINYSNRGRKLQINLRYKERRRSPLASMLSCANGAKVQMCYSYKYKHK